MDGGDEGDAISTLVYLNGAFLDAERASVPVSDHGFLFGDGLFETVRAYGGTPFRLRRHLERLLRDAQFLKMPPLPPMARLEAIVGELISRSSIRDGRIRITVTRGTSSKGLDIRGCKEATVLMTFSPLDLDAQVREEAGISAILLWRRLEEDLPSPAIKSTSYQRNVLARAQVLEAGAQEGFFLDESGNNATEGTISNLFMVRHGVLSTPPPTVCLPGITRAEVLDICGVENLQVNERALSVSELQSADEIFVTRSVGELIPVVKLSGLSVGKGVPGPLLERLRKRYRERTGAPS